MTAILTAILRWIWLALPGPVPPEREDNPADHLFRLCASHHAWALRMTAVMVLALIPYLALHKALPGAGLAAVLGAFMAFLASVHFTIQAKAVGEAASLAGEIMLRHMNKEFAKSMRAIEERFAREDEAREKDAQP